MGRVDSTAVDAMVAAMRHRGPDDQGVFAGPDSTIGMTRLSIQDLSAAGHQPMSADNGRIWIVYNGELYNTPSERAHLEEKGYRFTSRSDTEVVLKLYQHYGDDFLTRLRGIFALAIYDLRQGEGKTRVLLARDQLGVKPLLYSVQPGSVVFASEIKALVASGLVPPAIDPVALRLLLTYGAVYQPRTILQGVAMLPPAHRLVLERGRGRVERYWSLATDRQPELRRAPYPEQVERMRALIEDTVRLQLISDVPVGAFLSGGVDSASLVALMSKHIGGHTTTFSVGFESALKPFDESPLAKGIARHLGTDHHHVVVTGEDVRDRLEHIVAALDQPSVDGLNTYIVSRAAREGVTVAISGMGGDDLFMGYPWHASMLARGKTDGDFLDAYGAFCTDFHNTFKREGAARLIAPDLRAGARLEASYKADLQGIDELPDATMVQRMTALTLRGYTNNQLLRDIDAMSMAHSLEVRVPYLDPVFVDAALSLPDAAKLRKPVPDDPMRTSYRESGIKRILIDAARPSLPEGFDTVPKRGFGLPLKAWLETALRDVTLETLTEQRIKRHGLLDPAVVPLVRRAFVDGRMTGWRVWLLLVLDLWAESIQAIAAPRASGAGVPISASLGTGDRPAAAERRAAAQPRKRH